MDDIRLSTRSARAVFTAYDRRQMRFPPPIIRDLNADVAAADEAIAGMDIDPMDRGVHYLQLAKDLKKWLNAYRQGRRCSDSWDLRFSVGYCWYYLRQYDRALVHFNWLQEMDCVLGTLWAGNSLLLGYKYQADRALEAFLQACKLEPGWLYPVYRQAMALRVAGRYDAALEVLDRCLKADTEYSPAHFERGNVQRVAGSYEEAVASYRNCLRWEPNNAAARYLLGMTLVETGDVDGAGKQFNTTLAEAPYFAFPWLGKGNLAMMSRDMAKARQCYEQALRLSPDIAGVHVNMGVWCQIEGDTGQALQHMTRAANLAPHDPWIGVSLAMLHLETGSAGRARQLLITAYDEMGNSVKLRTVHAAEVCRWEQATGERFPVQ